MDSIDKQQDAVLLGLHQVSYIYLQVIAAVERALLTGFLNHCSFQSVLFLPQLWHHGITKNHSKFKRLLVISALPNSLPSFSRYILASQ